MIGLIASVLLLSPVTQDEIPDHPDKLKYPELTFDIPDATKMRSVLKSGTVVYSIEDPTLPLIQIAVYVKGGSFWEAKGKEGLADMCASVMRTGGTKTRTPAQIDEELGFLAANLEISMGGTSGVVTLSVLSKDLNRGLELLADVLRNPAFRQEKIDLYKAQLLASMKTRNDSTRSVESREADILFYGRDYPINKLPTKASIEGLSRENLQAFHRTFFHSNNFVVAAAGKFNRAALLEGLQKALGNWDGPPDKTPSYVPPVTYQPKPGVYCFNKDAKNITQGRISFGHLGIDIHNPDVQTLRIMNYILGGGGFSSRLMQKIRTEEGLAYDVRSSYQPGLRYTGTFRVSFQSKNQSCAYAIQLCLNEIKAIRGKLVPKEVVEQAKKFYIDGFPAFFFANKFQTVRTFAGAELNGYPKGYYQSYREKIAQVTPEAILAAAKKYIHPKKFVFICVGNIGVMQKGDGKHFNSLDHFGPVKMVPLPNPMTLQRTK